MGDSHLGRQAKRKGKFGEDEKRPTARSTENDQLETPWPPRQRRWCPDTWAGGTGRRGHWCDKKASTQGHGPLLMPLCPRAGWEERPLLSALGSAPHSGMSTRCQPLRSRIGLPHSAPGTVPHSRTATMLLSGSKQGRPQRAVREDHAGQDQH